MNLDAIGAWIAPFEGTRASAYDDATGQHVVPGYMMRGNVTVGIGINLCYPNGLAPEEIQWLFQHRVAKVAQSVAQAFPWFAGVPVELTFRGEDAVTISYDGSNLRALEAICSAFQGRAAITHAVDEECGTFVYLDGLH